MSLPLTYPQRLLGVCLFAPFAAIHACLAVTMLAVVGGGFVVMVWLLISTATGAPPPPTMMDPRLISWAYLVVGSIAAINTSVCLLTGRDNWFNALCLTQDQASFMTLSPIHVETVTERFCGHVLSSTLRLATEAEVQLAREAFEGTNQCDCTLVQDEAGWMYDYRACAICGKGLGAI